MLLCAATGQAGPLGRPTGELTAALKLLVLNAAASFAAVAPAVASTSSGSGSGGSGSGGTIPQESLAELVAQAIFHLDARTSRVIAVAPAAAPGPGTVVPAGVSTSQDFVRYFQEAARH
jgi:hypothetical protein